MGCKKKEEKEVLMLEVFFENQMWKQINWL